jgi:hypothetical protein
MSDKAKGAPKGQRFTHVYSDRGKPTQDSARMRRRLASLVETIDKSGDEYLSERAERELGIAAPRSQSGRWRDFLEAWELKDVLDLVTIAYRLLVERTQREPYARYRTGSEAQEFLAEVRRIFQEENVHYTVDMSGGVHFQFDEQFSKERVATIGSLQSDRYANARHSFESAMEALSKVPPDGKNAVRSVFAAAENVFKLIISKDRLGAKETDNLIPIIDKLYAADSNARNSAKKMLASLKDWVDAAHFYRHESASQEVAQRPLPLAIYWSAQVHRICDGWPNSTASAHPDPMINQVVSDGAQRNPGPTLPQTPPNFASLMQATDLEQSPIRLTRHCERRRSNPAAVREL